MILAAGLAAIPLPLQAQEEGDPYADRVVDFIPGELANPDLGNPETVLGPPDFNEQRLSGFLNLGVGGSITVAFENNVVLDGRGPDLQIHGDPANDERWIVEVSREGEVFVSFGEQPEMATLDLAEVGLPEARMVRLTDASAPSEGLSPGAELDAVEDLNAPTRLEPPPPAPPGQAQERVRLDAVEPPEGRPGQQLELTLYGGGFGGARQVRVAIGEFEVLEARIVSNEMVQARVFIPEDASPGPRPVEVVAVFGPNEEPSVRLDGGFRVLEARPNGSLPGWIVIVVVGLVLLVGAARWAGKQAQPDRQREPKKPQIRVQPHADLGNQQLDAGFLTRPAPEIRLKPVRGHVDSTIEPDPRRLVD